MAVEQANSATTLSLKYSPGQFKRLNNTQSQSVFSFGDFTVQASSPSDTMTGTPQDLQFDGFSTLQSMSGVGLNIQAVNYVKQNELKNPPDDPTTYAYFSSFYTEIVAAISSIIDNFPYAAVSYDSGVGTTIYSYSEWYDNTELKWYSTFNVPYSAITNQGSLAFNTGSTVTNTSVLTDTDQFSIQLSGTNKSTYTIVNYIFSSTSNSFLYFKISGRLSCLSASTSTTEALYIRPTVERLNEYKRNITKLEKHLLDSGVFDVPDVVYADGTTYKETFTWPKTIDGFNPDASGTDFEAYQESILAAATKIDDEQTNIFLKSLIPDSYTEYDSDSQVLTTIIQTYAQEFDNLKRYIDGIAYAHSINYNDEESVPNKFMHKLSQLLGWKLSDSFSEMDMFDYLVGEDNDEENSYSYFNLEIWRRILINLVWLYKKKGTRDALTFIFKLLGAPDCLIVLDEFIYKINQTYSSLSPKVNNDGYINYDYSTLAFQEGGSGRGDGQAYINQWMPEFTPQKILDNIKVYTGGTFGTQNIINTKEINIGLDPAKAVECDTFYFYSAYTGSCFGICSGTSIDITDVYDWRQVGGGVGSSVYSIVFSGSDMYVGGNFNTVSGTSILMSGVARWDGTNWNSVGGGTSGGGAKVSIAFSGTDMFIGGTFTAVSGGTIPVTKIAKWDGTNWRNLNANNFVYAIAANSSGVYVGGKFATIDGFASQRLARWDGVNWNSVGGNLDNSVHSIALNGSNVYVGGQFTELSGGTILADRIARWDGTNWYNVGGGANGIVSAIAFSGSDVYIGGDFTSVSGGTIPVNGIARWDGTNWYDVGGGVAPIGSFTINSIVSGSSGMYVGGTFTTVSGGTIPANRIVKWDGTNWSDVGSGVDNNIYSIALSGSDVYVGGAFTSASGGTIPMNRIGVYERDEVISLGPCSDYTASTTPAEYQIVDCSDVRPENMSAMTLNQYLDYVYTNIIEPRNRKTNIQCHTTWYYPELRKAYLNYYYSTNPTSNRLTVKKLESYLELVEKPLRDYVFQLIPATSIFNQIGSTYRNPMYHRQRFVYKWGINDGSEFRVGLPPNITTEIGSTFKINVTVPTVHKSHISTFNISSVFPVFISGDKVTNYLVLGDKQYLMDEDGSHYVDELGNHYLVQEGYGAHVTKKKVFTITTISSRITTTHKCTLRPIDVHSVINDNNFYNRIPAVSVSSEIDGTTTKILQYL